MSSVKVYSLSSQEYFRILPFLHPTYSVVSHMMLPSHFITRHDVVSVSDREQLDYLYHDCVILSTRIFDEVFNEEVMCREVLSFAQRVFGSRKRVFRPHADGGAALVDECLQFMFSDVPPLEEDTEVVDMLSQYGSQAFVPMYLRLCQERGSTYVISCVNTFIQKVLGGSNTPFYQRARMRIGQQLRSCLVSGVESSGQVSAAFRKEFPELHSLWLYMNFMKRAYVG